MFFLLFPETLNGKLDVHQTTQWSGSHPVDTFSTATNITLNTIITDHFHRPTYTTVWKIDGPQDNVTYHSHNTSLSVLLSARGRYVLYIAVIIHTHVKDQLGKLHNSQRNTSFTHSLLLKGISPFSTDNFSFSDFCTLLHEVRFVD
jgi:hypothetical protein